MDSEDKEVKGTSERESLVPPGSGAGGSMGEIEARVVQGGPGNACAEDLIHEPPVIGIGCRRADEDLERNDWQVRRSYRR